MVAAGRPDRLHLAGLEGILDLPVEVVAVGNYHDARIGYFLVERQRPAEHDHGQRLAGSLRVPDDAALAPAIDIEVANAFHRLANAEKLLVTGNLARAGIEHGESAN